MATDAPAAGMVAQAGTAVPGGAAAGMAGQAGAAVGTAGRGGAEAGMVRDGVAAMAGDGAVPIGDGAHGPITRAPIMAATQLPPHRALRVDAGSLSLSTLL
jgi:hypothetical protein